MLHTLLGVLLAALALPILNNHAGPRLIRWWCKHLLRCFNIQVRTYGQPPEDTTQRTMFVANHISWADIHAINSIIPVRFIAKMEIKEWPIFGYLVKKSGTLFINRTLRKDAARIVHMTAEALKQDENVCFFPEGTTSEGTHVLPFKSSIVQAAITAQATVWPIAIYYPKLDKQPNLTMAYAGDTSMITSMLNIFSIQYPVVELHFLTPIASAQHTRQSITQLAHSMIVQQHQLLLPTSD